MSYSLDDYEKNQKDRDLMSARCELTQAKALLVLLKNNELAAEIHIAGMKMGTINNAMLIPVVQYQIGELNKFLKGKPNEWE